MTAATGVGAGSAPGLQTTAPRPVATSAPAASSSAVSPRGPNPPRLPCRATVADGTVMATSTVPPAGTSGVSARPMRGPVRVFWSVDAVSSQPSIFVRVSRTVRLRSRSMRPAGTAASVALTTDTVTARSWPGVRIPSAAGVTVSVTPSVAACAGVDGPATVPAASVPAATATHTRVEIVRRADRRISRRALSVRVGPASSRGAACICRF